MQFVTILRVLMVVSIFVCIFIVYGSGWFLSTRCDCKPIESEKIEIHN